MRERHRAWSTKSKIRARMPLEDPCKTRPNISVSLCANPVFFRGKFCIFDAGGNSSGSLVLKAAAEKRSRPLSRTAGPARWISVPAAARRALTRKQASPIFDGRGRVKLSLLGALLLQTPIQQQPLGSLITQPTPENVLQRERGVPSQRQGLWARYELGHVHDGRRLRELGDRR